MLGLVVACLLLRLFPGLSIVVVFAEAFVCVVLGYLVGFGGYCLCLCFLAVCVYWRVCLFKCLVGWL